MDGDDLIFGIFVLVGVISVDELLLEDGTHSLYIGVSFGASLECFVDSEVYGVLPYHLSCLWIAEREIDVPSLGDVSSRVVNLGCSEQTSVAHSVFGSVFGSVFVS